MLNWTIPEVPSPDYLSLLGNFVIEMILSISALKFKISPEYYEDHRWMNILFYEKLQLQFTQHSVMNNEEIT